MDFVKAVSATLGKVITEINEEELMEEVMRTISLKPVKQVADWFMKFINALPEGTTMGELMGDLDAYEDLLEEAMKIEEMFTEEELAELRQKIRQEEVEPE